MAIQIPYTDGFVLEPSTSNAEFKANKGVANGYAPLDATSKVPFNNLPENLVTTLIQEGRLITHNADTTAVHGITDTSNLNSIIAGSGIAMDEYSESGGNGGTINIKGGTGYGEVGGNAGSINLSGGEAGNAEVGGNGGSILLQGLADGADAGSINLSGSNGTGGGNGGSGGSIISIGSGDYNGGTLNMSAEGMNGNGGSINTSNKGGSINTSGYDADVGGSLNLSAGEFGVGGSINGSNKGGSITFIGSKLRTGGSISLNAGTPVGYGDLSGSVGFGGDGGLLQLKGGNGGEESNFGNGGNGGTILGNGGNAITIGETEDGETILGAGHNAGTINFSAGANGAGGNIDTSAGQSGSGGSINTSNGGGSISLVGSQGASAGSISMNAGVRTELGYGAGDGGNSGSINLSGANNSDGSGGNGGLIDLHGGTEDGHGGSILLNGNQGSRGGSITSIGGGQYNANQHGGSLNMSSGSSGSGGSIDTSNGGGSINTKGVGSIQLGVSNTRTTLNGSASATDKTITLPNETGIVALTPQIPYGGIVSASAVDAFSGAGTYAMIQGSGVGGSIQVAPDGAITIASAGTGYVDGQAIRAGGSRYNLVTQATQPASANLPIITKAGGGITTGTFGTTANSFCQGNDVRLGSQTIFTLSGEAKTVFALSTSYLYGCMPTRGPQLSGSYTSAVSKILGNFTVTGISIHQYLPSLTGATLTYQLVRVTSSSTVESLGSSVVVAGNNNLTTATSSISASLNSGDHIGLMLTLGASGTVPVATAATTILANIYCVPR